MTVTDAAGAAAGAGTPTKADTAHFKRGAAARDRERDGAYWAGHRGETADNIAGDTELEDLYREGQADRGKDPAQRNPPSTRQSAGPGRSSSSSGQGNGWASRAAGGTVRSLTSSVDTDDLAGLVMGMLGYVIVINYLRGGLPQVKGWFAAKFLNRPYTAAAATTATGVGTPTAAGGGTVASAGITGGSYSLPATSKAAT